MALNKAYPGHHSGVSGHGDFSIVNLHFFQLIIRVFEILEGFFLASSGTAATHKDGFFGKDFFRKNRSRPLMAERSCSSSRFISDIEGIGPSGILHPFGL